MLIYIALVEGEEDKGKFERIYLSYRQTMFYAANRILKNHHTAEDAVHQAFLRIVDNLDKINEDDCHKTRAFLVVIVEHIAIDIYRNQKRESTLSFDEFEIYIGDSSLSEHEITDDVFTAIASLPVNYSTVLRLKYSQGYENFEIAQILGITEENLRQRISRAKKKLGQLLEEAGDVNG